MGPAAIGIMVVAGIGMLVGLAKQKAGATWGKPLAVACIVVALATALMNIVKSTTGGGTGEIVEREQLFQKIGTKKLALYLAEKYPGAKALILTEPRLGAQANKPNILVEGLKEGFGTKITVVAEISPDIPKNAANSFAAEMPSAEGGEAGMEGEMLPPLEYWYTGALLQKLLDKHAGTFDMLVSTIGLPQDANRMKIWKSKNKPKVVIANGSVYELKSAIKNGMIVGAVTYNPKAEYDDKPVPKDLDEAFDKRFLLLTPETVDEVASQHGDIFRN